VSHANSGEMTRAMRRVFGADLGAVFVTGLIFLLLGLMVLLLENFRSYDSRLRSDISLQVFLQDDVTPIELYQMGLQLRALPEVRSVRYKSKTEAFHEMQSLLGDQLLPDDATNPFPASFLVSFSQHATTLSHLQAVADSLTQERAVDQVSFNREWLQSQEPILEFLRVLSTFLALLVFAAAVIQVFWAVSRTALTRKDEIEVFKSAGAGWRHIGMPLLVEGSALGLLSGILGIIVLYFLWLAAKSLPIHPEFVSASSMVAVPLAGLFSGLTASYVVVRRLLN
jgi:cell division transport system permease protein